ncbi:MAG TPA: outer membrane beta-barrel protein [Terriglobales bacterium]|nr:outer membrane beta-barrel protein [Terriglobales bacterium]
MLKRAFAAVLFIILLGTRAVAQDEGRFDASVAWGVALGKSATNNVGNVTDSPTNSPLLLGTFRFRFNHMHSVEFNAGRTLDSQIFIIPPDEYRVEAKIMEYSGAYVFSPIRFHKLEPFVFVGGGALRFSPGNTYIDGFQSAFGASRQTSKAFLYGGGVNYPVWRRIGLRLQYRGLVYKEPTFRLQQFFTGANGQMPEATIGVVYKF